MATPKIMDETKEKERREEIRKAFEEFVNKTKIGKFSLVFWCLGHGERVWFSAFGFPCDCDNCMAKILLLSEELKDMAKTTIYKRRQRGAEKEVSYIG